MINAQNYGRASSCTASETAAQRMAHFDKLPREVRQALANARGDWTAENVLAAWRQQRKLGVSAKAFARVVSERDAKFLPNIGEVPNA